MVQFNSNHKIIQVVNVSSIVGFFLKKKEKHIKNKNTWAKHWNPINRKTFFSMVNIQNENMATSSLNTQQDSWQI